MNIKLAASIVAALLLATETAQAGQFNPMRSANGLLRQHAPHGEMVPTLVTASLITSSGEIPMEV
jgi:hypothetical protein